MEIKLTVPDHLGEKICQILTEAERLVATGAKVYSREQLAERYGVDTRTVTEWMSSGRIAFLKIGRSVRFNEAHIAAFEKAHTVKAVV